jgi:hypothetical protein
MATTEKKPMNILQKLAQARLRFLNEHIKKSGKNMKLEFTYFELKDIVPSATKIFADLGIASLVNFDSEEAKMELYNADNPEESPVIFTIPYKEAPVIVSNAGKEVTNPLQALGATITYLRRYLYMLALDIVEDDETDANLGSETKEIKDEKPKKPATPAERKQTKKKLTEEASAPATAEQIEKLKELGKYLVEKDPEKQRDFVSQIALKTKGFTAVSADQAKQLIEHMEGMRKEYDAVEQ